MSLGTIIENYELVKEYKRVIQTPQGGFFTTRLRIYKNQTGDFFPEWEHSIKNYIDTSPQSTPTTLVSLWESKIITVTSQSDIKKNPSF